MGPRSRLATGIATTAVTAAGWRLNEPGGPREQATRDDNPGHPPPAAEHIDPPHQTQHGPASPTPLARPTSVVTPAPPVWVWGGWQGERGQGKGGCRGWHTHLSQPRLPRSHLSVFTSLVLGRIAILWR